MGAAVRIPVIEAGAMPEAITQLRAKGITCLAAALYKSQPLSAAQASYPGGVCVVIGSEGQGLTDETIAACSSTVRIPMTDRVESLNAGIAGSVLLAFPGGKPMSGLAGQTSLFPPEPAPDPLLCWLWLAHVLGPASVHAGRVLDAFGGAQEAWEARDTAEFRLAAGEAAALRAQQLAPEQYHPLVMRCDDLGVRILPYDDPDYPLAFSRISDMPLVLYCTGDPRWLNEPAAVGMVGTRKPTEYGLRAAEDIGGASPGRGHHRERSGRRTGQRRTPGGGRGELPYHRGDGRPHRPDLSRRQWVLRRAIERRGCVISEYPPESEPVGAVGFLQRNRLIAALSGALVVVEAKEKSGTMSTVAHAERYGKPVFAVPGSIYSPNSAGTNGLLRDGRARAVCSVRTCLARWACAGRVQRR